MFNLPSFNHKFFNKFSEFNNLFFLIFKNLKIPNLFKLMIVLFIIILKIYFNNYIIGVNYTNMLSVIIII